MNDSDRQDYFAELERCRLALGVPQDKPVCFIAERAREVVRERDEWKVRSTDYEGRWATLCDLLGVAYGADVDTALGDLRELMQGGKP